MTSLRHAPAGAALFLTLVAGMAQAAPSGQQTCSKMIADGRAGQISQAQCQCMYRVADAVLDDDIKALLFDSWYTGADNMSAIEALPGRNRVELQMRKMDRTLKANC